MNPDQHLSPETRKFIEKGFHGVELDPGEAMEFVDDLAFMVAYLRDRLPVCPTTKLTKIMRRLANNGMNYKRVVKKFPVTQNLSLEIMQSMFAELEESGLKIVSVSMPTARMNGFMHTQFGMNCNLDTKFDPKKGHLWGADFFPADDLNPDVIEFRIQTKTAARALRMDEVIKIVNPLEPDRDWCATGRLNRW